MILSFYEVWRHLPDYREREEFWRNGGLFSWKIYNWMERMFKWEYEILSALISNIATYRIFAFCSSVFSLKSSISSSFSNFFKTSLLNLFSL